MSGVEELNGSTHSTVNSNLDDVVKQKSVESGMLFSNNTNTNLIIKNDNDNDVDRNHNHKDL